MTTRATSTGMISSTSGNISNMSSKTSTNKKRPPVFPTRLYEMLENAERDGYDHLISWISDGKAFKIHIDGRLEEEDEKAIVDVLKKTFNQTRFKSFLRQLQLYGFERIYKGPRRGECRHELFARGRQDLFQNKSIEDFQQRAADSSNRTPKRMKKLLRQISPTTTPFKAKLTSSSFVNNVDSRIWSSDLPTCPPLTTSGGHDGSKCESKCEYLKTSIIPTQLVNLVLPEADSNSTCGRQLSVFSRPNDEYDDDEVSMNTDHDEDNMMLLNDENGMFDWTGMELEILQGAL